MKGSSEGVPVSSVVIGLGSLTGFTEEYQFKN